ncbi:hypothetical protein [Pedobacter psychrodurus]|uniref:hypothetical protein n=1 Tax=Pedobacter psychrodurus TaxID=2530456 RepID=UPI00292F57AE|nr:hypothetical protein [Pedobacter psychrodurus]
MRDAKQLDDLPNIKSQLEQLNGNTTGIKDVTKSTILDIINDGIKGEKLSDDERKQEEIDQIRKRRVLESVKKVTKNASISTFQRY